MKPSLCLTLLLVLTCVIMAISGQDFPNQLMVLGRPEAPLYILRWRANSTDVAVELEARTLGWIALGRSPDGRMDKSDILFSWIDTSGTIYAQDRFIIADDRTMTVNLTLDRMQNWQLLSGRQNATHTTIRATRKIVSPDPADYSFSDPSFNLVYSMGDNPPDRSTGEIKMHSSRGSRVFSGFKQLVVGPAIMPSMTMSSSANTTVIPGNSPMSSPAPLRTAAAGPTPTGTATATTLHPAVTPYARQPVAFTNNVNTALLNRSPMGSTTQVNLKSPMQPSAGAHGQSDVAIVDSSSSSNVLMSPSSSNDQHHNQMMTMNRNSGSNGDNSHGATNGNSDDNGQGAAAGGAAISSGSSSWAVDNSGMSSGSDLQQSVGSGSSMSGSGSVTSGVDNSGGDQPLNLFSMSANGPNMTANILGIPVSFSIPTGNVGLPVGSAVTNPTLALNAQVLTALEQMWALIGSFMSVTVSPPAAAVNVNDGHKR